MSKKIIQILIFSLIFISWIVLDYQKLTTNNLQIWSSTINSKTNILIKKSANYFSFGTLNNHLIQQIKPFFSNPKITDINELLLKSRENLTLQSKQ